MSITEKPWGTYEILHEDEKCKIKKITVNPLKRLSLQSHTRRSEHWTFLEGEGLFQKGFLTSNIHSYEVRGGSNVYIPCGALHRIENVSEKNDLVFIEVQTGSYFGEDDIQRYEDDFGRDVEVPPNQKISYLEGEAGKL